MASAQTTFTELVGIEFPLQLAGMGGLSTVELAASVSNRGGLGMLALPLAGPEELEENLRDLGSRTDRPFGVTFIMPFLNPECVPVAAEHARVVEFSFAEPDAELVAVARARGALVGWQVGTARDASVAEQAEVDFVIAQGTEAGGHHVAQQPLASALPPILREVGVPVVAAGGIGTAADVRAVLEVGAAAARVGTRFALADEADIHRDYAAALIAAGADDTAITTEFHLFWPDTPHRVLRSSIHAVRAESGPNIGKDGTGERAIDVPLRAPLLPRSRFVGNAAAAALYAGTSVRHATGRAPAADIVDELVAELKPKGPDR